MSVFRILDANLNRAREGLRVVEEYARFVLDDAAITERLKRARHDLRAAVDVLQTTLAARGETLLEHRDTPGDVGVAISTPEESVRPDVESVALASLKRLQEALRVLAEYGKTVSADAAARFESIRYAAYAMESDLFANPPRVRRLRAAKLYVLVTGKLASADALTTAREAVAGGADLIQMREKEMEDGEFYELALKMNEICRSGNALFFVNDRPHVARLADADGIHTGQGDLPVTLARRVLGSGRLIGKSTNCPERAAAALADGADYIGVGPVFPTNTKQHRAAVGLDYVHWAATESKLPYFCIGSINRKTLGAVLDAGARAVAVCTAIIGAKDIAAEAAWFKARLSERAPSA